jgi:glycosyltransferase involved in cell wall biosynthesis
MARGRRSILIDARVNGFPGAYGLARSVVGLAAHMSEPDDGLALRVVVNPREAQIFPLSGLPAHVDVISTDVTVFGLHRCWELARLIRAVDAAVLYVPYPTFTPLIRPCPFVLALHDCTIEADVGFAGGWGRQAAMRMVTGMALRRAAAVTAPSRVSLADIRRHYPAAPNPTLIPNGVDLRQFGQVTADAVAAARGRYQLPERFILSVGAHRPHKNHEVLVRALAAVPGDAGLVVVGYTDQDGRRYSGRLTSTTNFNQVTPPPPGNTPDPLWQHSPHVWLLDMGMQLALTAVLAGLTWWRLYQARPGRRH